MLLFTIVTNELVVELQGGPSMMRFLKISRQARPEFEISISIITQSGDFKVTATGGKKHIIDSPPCSCLGSYLRFFFLEEIEEV